MQNPYPTNIIDNRPDSHGSLSVIPRFLPGDYDRLQSHWKFEILFTHGYERAESGQLFWAIDAIEVKAGPAVLQPQVRNLDNTLFTISPGILMFNHWPGAPAIDFSADPRYFDNAVVGFTEGNGSIGWGFSGEAWINAAEPESHNGGPFSVWCHSHPENFQPPEDRVIGSDCLHKIGWWDDHIVINPIFRITRKAGPVTPPPNGGDSKLVVFDQLGAFVGQVNLNSGEGIGGRIALFSGDVEQAHVNLE